MKLWSGLRGLPRENWVLFVATFINRAGTMVLPFLVLYLTNSLGISPGRAGFILALYGFAALITAPLSGRLCDHYGSLRIMKLSLFLSSMALLLFPFAKTFSTVVIATLVLSTTVEMFRPANLAYLSGLVQPEQRKAAFALNRLALNLGMSIGPAVGGFLASVSFRYLFILDGLTSLVAGVFLFLKLKEEQLPHKVDKTAGRTDLETDAMTNLQEATENRRQLNPLRALKDPRLRYFLIAFVPINIVFFQHISAMPVFFVHDLHLSVVVYGLMFTVNTLLIIFLEVPINLATTHWSHRFTLFLGCLLFSIGFGALVLARGVWSVTATVIIWTFGEMILFPGSSAYVAHIAPPDRQGEYMGLYVMAFAMGFAIGPWIGMQVLERFGSQFLWLAVFVVGTISAALMLRIREGEAAPAKIGVPATPIE